MGEHKHNPMAEGYVLGSGKTPPIQISAHIDCQIVASKAWMEANPPDPETGKRPECPPDQAEVVLLLLGTMVIPSAVAPKKDWAAGIAPIGELMRMSWTEYVLCMVKENAHLAPALNAAAPVEGGEN